VSGCSLDQQGKVNPICCDRDGGHGCGDKRIGVEDDGRRVGYGGLIWRVWADAHVKHDVSLAARRRSVGRQESRQRIVRRQAGSRIERAKRPMQLTARFV